MRVDVAIVFALKEEFDQFRPSIPASRKPHVDARTGRTFLTYDVETPQGSYACVTTFVGSMGLLDVALLAEHMLRTFEPRTVVVIGLAGGLGDDVRVGDVVIADEVHDYLHDGKVTPHGFAHGGRSYRPHARLRNAIQYFELAHEAAMDELGRASLEDMRSTVPAAALDAAGDAVRRGAARILIGPIASGSIVVADPAFGAWLRSLNRKCLAVEMESAGLLNAVYQHAGDERTLVIRAISDLADERKAQLDRTSSGALRALAMRNAIRLFGALLETGQLDRGPAAAPVATPIVAPEPVAALIVAAAPAAAPIVAPEPARIAAAVTHGLPRSSPSTEVLLAGLDARDPLICLPAADALARREVDIEAVLRGALGSATQLMARRRVIAAHAARALPVLFHDLEHGDWTRAAAAADLFVPELGNDTARRLADKIDRSGDVDGVRLRILALGRMAAVDYAFKPAMLLGAVTSSSYLFEKWEAFCVRALARIFARSCDGSHGDFEPRSDPDTAGRLYVEGMMASLAGSHDANRHAFERMWTLLACGPLQADVALARFLRADHLGLRIDATRILGATRLSRGVKPLIELLERRDGAAEHAAWALAQIGGPAALEALRRHDRRYELAWRSAELPEDWLRAQLARAGEPSLGLLRGAGLQRSAACRGAIEGGLEASDAGTRGCAALALARLDGGAALARVTRCHEEASERIERLFAILAILVAAPERHDAYAVELREQLAHGSYLLEPMLIEDILAVLRATPGAEAVHAMWAYLYGPGRVIWHG